MDMIEDDPQNANQTIQELRQQIDDMKHQARQAQQQLQALIQQQNNEIQHWQTIIQLIRQNWYETDVKASYMQHAKNEAITDLNNVIALIQQDQQQANQVLQSVQRIENND